MNYKAEVKNNWGVFKVAASSFDGALYFSRRTMYLITESADNHSISKPDINNWSLQFGDLTGIHGDKVSQVTITLPKDGSRSKYITLDVAANQLEALRQYLNDWHYSLSLDRSIDTKVVDFNEAAREKLAQYEVDERDMIGRSSELWDLVTFEERQPFFDRAERDLQAKIAKKKDEMSRYPWKLSTLLSGIYCGLGWISGDIRNFGMPRYLSDNPELEYVYAMLAKESGRVKIGISKSPESRLKQVQTSAPERVELISVTPSLFARPIESSLHEIFDDERVTGEWFDLDEDKVSALLEFMNDCKDYYRKYIGEVSYEYDTNI